MGWVNWLFVLHEYYMIISYSLLQVTTMAPYFTEWCLNSSSRGAIPQEQEQGGSPSMGGHSRYAYFVNFFLHEFIKLTLKTLKWT